MPRTKTTRVPGWGGAPSGRPAVNPQKGNKPGPGRGKVGPHKAALREKLYEKMEEIAFNSESEALQLAASDKLLDRIEGKPIQRSLVEADVTSHVVEEKKLEIGLRKLSTEELREYVQLNRKVGVLLPGEAPPIDSEDEEA